MRQYKRAIAFVLILAAVIAIIPKNDSERKVEAAPAATPTPTVASAFESSNGEITGFDFSVENVVIPASINGVTVTKIGQSAFLYTGFDSGISTIVVPSTVTFVGDYAFGYNELLQCDLFLTEKVRR